MFCKAIRCVSNCLFYSHLLLCTTELGAGGAGIGSCTASLQQLNSLFIWEDLFFYSRFCVVIAREIKKKKGLNGNVMFCFFRAGQFVDYFK